MTQRSAGEVAPTVIERAKQGDEAAFVAIVRHYDPGLRALAYRLLRDSDGMDDALQEAYVKAFRAMPRFRGDAKIGTWLYRIAYNACLDELAASRRVVSLPLESLATQLDPASAMPDEVASTSELTAALDRLSAEDRAAVLLVDAQDFSYRDAADVLGVPEGTIASRLNRARTALRTAIASPIEGASKR